MMATVAEVTPARARPWAADALEKLLAAGTIALGIAMATAIIRGRAQWGEIPLLVWLHLLTVGTAVALTPVLLLAARGTRTHRRLGQVWANAMAATALISLGIHDIDPGGFSFIHIFSAVTLVGVPFLWWTARRHQVAHHRRIVRGLVTGALLTAGLFAFPYGRLLGDWLFG